ncbi:MAG: hypothetical protein K5669_09160 [Lachnospiraceae bacterium]|nr:hypothetical protein [Lachnospiraceae bacterium]
MEEWLSGKTPEKDSVSFVVLSVISVPDLAMEETLKREKIPAKMHNKTRPTQIMRVSALRLELANIISGFNIFLVCRWIANFIN